MKMRDGVNQHDHQKTYFFLSFLSVTLSSSTYSPDGPKMATASLQTDLEWNPDSVNYILSG